VADELGRPGHLALATWGLFAGLALLMLGGGVFSTLLGVRSEQVGLPTLVSSAISASYYVGFIVGTRLTLRGLRSVGHIRVYGALASILAAAMVATGITGIALAWGLLRLVVGLTTAGLYVVAESWLNELADNTNRARLLSVYAALTVAFWGVGQILVFAFEAQDATGYSVAAILTCLAVAPVALSEEAVAPGPGVAGRMTLRQLVEQAPTGVGAYLLVGVTHGAMNGMVAIYATRIGMTPGEVGVFAAIPALGGMLLQYPVSSASDDLDRRAVGVAAATLAAGVSLLLALGPQTGWTAFALMGLLGGFTYPLWVIAAAYANDWIDPRHVSAAASQLVTLYGVGAVVGPFVAAGAMVVIGTEGFFWSLVALHVVVATFFVYRMFASRAPLTKRPWSEVSLPARTLLLPVMLISVTRRRGGDEIDARPDEQHDSATP